MMIVQPVVAVDANPGRVAHMLEEFHVMHGPEDEGVFAGHVVAPGQGGGDLVGGAGDQDDARLQVEIHADVEPQRQQPHQPRVFQAPEALRAVRQLGPEPIDDLVPQGQGRRIAPPARRQGRQRIPAAAQAFQEPVVQFHQMEALVVAALVELVALKVPVGHVDAETVQRTGRQRCAAAVHSQHDGQHPAWCGRQGRAGHAGHPRNHTTFAENLVHARA